MTGSWVLTSAIRHYDRTVGISDCRWGAPESAVRFSHEHLDDGVLHGGTIDETYVEFDWWATQRWKFDLGWGHTWLKRFGETGVTDSLQTRWQWIYCSQSQAPEALARWIFLYCHLVMHERALVPAYAVSMKRSSARFGTPQVLSFSAFVSGGL
jgi:hypothetical protein